MTIHGFRGNIKENNLKNSTLNMLKIQPYIDAIEINSVNVQSKSASMEALNIKGVAEPCAIQGAKMNKGKFKFMKRKSFDRKITLAVVSCYR